VAVSCPHCQSKATRRSKRRGTFELTVLSLIPMRPFRCEDCDRRFYAFASPTGAIQSDTEASR
jgi:DNA-directed RNA polymerase subunit RPC12/RpoP